MLRRRREKAAIAAENGRRGLMRLVLAEPGGGTELTPATARRAFAAASGLKEAAVLAPQIEAAVRELGGEVDLDANGVVVYRFSNEARERRALLALRGAAPLAEARPGEVVFSSGDEPRDALDVGEARLLIDTARDPKKR
jgi:hypothetical protein